MRARVLLLVCSSLLVVTTMLASPPARADAVVERAYTVTSWDGVPLEVYVQEPPGFDPERAYPVVFHGHGWGGSAPRGGLQRRYAEEGYLAVGWSVRGFGSSGGRVGVNGPKEAQDIVALIDWVTERYRVSNHDGAPGKLDIGFVGDSYGGGSAYLAARFDPRVKAIAPGMPWSRLDYSLYPNGSPKLGWDLALFAAGIPTSGAGYDTMLYEWFVSLATTVGVDDTLSDLRWRSVADDLERLNRNGAAVLINQGISDTLFTGSEATHIWDRLTVPKKLYQTNIGHSNHPQATAPGAPRPESQVRNDLTLAWFDHWLKGHDNGIVHLDGATGCLAGDPANGLLAGGDAPVLLNHLRQPYDERRLGRQEDWNGAAVEPVELHLAADPAGVGVGTLGEEASGSSVLANTVIQTGVTTGETFDVAVTGIDIPPMAPGAVVPASEAVFRSAPLDLPMTISGEPHLSVQITPLSLGVRGEPDGLFQLTAKLYDVAPDGSRALLQRGVMHAGGLEPGAPARIAFDLYALVHDVAAGHALELELATSDVAHVAPSASAGVAVIDHGADPPSSLTLPLRHAGRTKWAPPAPCGEAADPEPPAPERPGNGGGGPGHGGGVGGGRHQAPGQQGRSPSEAGGTAEGGEITGSLVSSTTTVPADGGPSTAALALAGLVVLAGTAGHRRRRAR